MTAYGVPTTNKEIQEDELQVLKSIYDNELTDLRQKDPWKVWRPPEMLIRLQPSQGLRDRAQKHSMEWSDTTV